jgi:membrane protease YdiL (CAAX protease family)
MSHILLGLPHADKSNRISGRGNVIAFAAPLAENSQRTLTAAMAFLLNFPLPLMLVEAGASDINRLSEAELLARYPALAMATTLLLSAGFLCDFYLLFRLSKRVDSLVNEPLLRIGPKPWSMRDLCFAAGALILVLATGNTLVALTLNLAHVDDADAMPWLLVSNMVLYALSSMGFLEFFRRRQIGWRQALGFSRESILGAASSGGLFFLAALPPLAATFVVYGKLCQVIGIKDTPQPVAELLVSTDSTIVLVLVSIFAIAVAPIFEEFFFRGFAYPALKQRWGMWKSLAFVSAVFAVVHQHLPSIGPLFALAFGLGLAYEFTGSLVAPITMHALFNTMNVGMLLYVRAHS